MGGEVVEEDEGGGERMAGHFYLLCEIKWRKVLKDEKMRHTVEVARERESLEFYLTCENVQPKST